jgi:putative tryptophan/tyrosine transport system substrate-binding protein
VQFERLRRREFIALLGGSAFAWPRAVRAQRASKVPTIGFLASGTQSSHGRWVSAFVQRLGELSWIEGRTVAMEVRWAEGRGERAAEIAADFVRLKVDAVVTTGTPATLAVMQATAVIPIVFVGAVDPVGNKLVASLARPGGNVTGLSNQWADLVGKRLELLREVVPGLRRLAILVNAGNPAAMLDLAEAQAAAGTLGLAVVPFKIHRAEDIAPAFEALKGRADALYVQGDMLMLANRVAINTWALGERLPTMHGLREDVEAGGLMSYGPGFPDLYRRAAGYVDKILRGTKPGDIPVEQPTKFDLVVNVTTARVLGLTIPESFLLRADELIQ